MSKVIFKIGPVTNMVDQKNITTMRYGSRPTTTIKFARDHSVVFFERNPYYVTITEPSEVKQICTFLEEALTLQTQSEEATREGNLELAEELTTQHRRRIAMASMNIESTIAAYISANLFDGVSTSIIKALRAAKKIGYEASQRNSESV